MPKTRLASPRRTRASKRSSAQKAARARGLAITRVGDLGEVAFVHKAMSLDYVVAKPYGQMHRYDFMVEGGNRIWRVQVKTTTCMRDGRYQLCVQRITHRRCVAYKKSELDFVIAYLMPVKTWYILPISLVAGRRSFLLAPPGFRGKNPLAQYQEAWHLLGKPAVPPL
jgi:PD-(D/E)XK endonuclease